MELKCRRLRSSSLPDKSQSIKLKGLKLKNIRSNHSNPKFKSLRIQQEKEEKEKNTHTHTQKKTFRNIFHSELNRQFGKN